MSDPVFFPSSGALTLERVCALAGIPVPDGASGDEPIRGVASLELAGPDDLAYMDNPKYGEALGLTQARACLVSRRFAAKVPASVHALVCNEPYRVFAQVLAVLHPGAMRPGPVFGSQGIAPGSTIHPTARLEQGVTVDPGAVIGPHAEIGSGTIIGANAVIGPHVRIGRDCSVAPNATIQCALIGNRVIIHPGVQIGQDGFGFAMSPRGHLKVPQIGRVIIQDDVEIGANTTIDRGASRDTVIGEGTKIDNQVQIGHNVVIGRHCVIVSQVGLAGSTTLEDFVALGGKVGSAGHLTVGAGAQIAATSNIAGDVPAGARWGGSPAKPVREWFRELMTLSRLAARDDASAEGRAKERGEGE